MPEKFLGGGGREGEGPEVERANNRHTEFPQVYTSPCSSRSAYPQNNFDKIIEKYVEMNIAHPFREGNGRAMRIWLDIILKKEITQVIDWNLVDKKEYLSAMERSVVNDVEIKNLLRQALTDQIHDRILFMKGIDISYYYEGYSEFKTSQL